MRDWKVLLLSMVGAVALFALAPSGASAADLDCADFSNQAEAQRNLLPGDPYRLDGDSDDVACEDLPCPCSTSSGPPPITTEPMAPPKLSKPAARRAAKHKARRFVRQHRNIQALSFGGCSRSSAHKVVCRFVLHGGRASCRLRIKVRGEGSDAHATIARVRCRR